MTDFKFQHTPNQDKLIRVDDWLSLTRTRQIGLPAYVAKKHNIKQHFVHMYWDKQNRAIAIVFTDDKSDEAYNVDFGEQGGAVLRCGRFFSENTIDVIELAGRYDYKVLPAVDIGIPRAGQAFLILLSDRRAIYGKK